MFRKVTFIMTVLTKIKNYQQNCKLCTHEYKYIGLCNCNTQKISKRNFHCNVISSKNKLKIVKKIDSEVQLSWGQYSIFWTIFSLFLEDMTSRWKIPFEIFCMLQLHNPIYIREYTTCNCSTFYVLINTMSNKSQFFTNYSYCVSKLWEDLLCH